VTSLALPTAAAATSLGGTSDAEVFRRFDAVSLASTTAGVGSTIRYPVGPGGVGPDGLHGYIAGLQSGIAALVKFRLSDLAIIGVLPMAAERTRIGGVVVNGAHAYLGTGTSGNAHYVEKVRLDAAAGSGVVAGMLHVGDSGSIHTLGETAAMIVADADHVVTTDLNNTTSGVYKTRMHAGTDLPPEYLGTVTIHPDNGTRTLRIAVGLASDGTHLYATDEAGPLDDPPVGAKMTKIALSGNATAGTGGMEVVGELVLGPDDGYPYGLVHSGGYLYVASWTSSAADRAAVVKVATSGGTAPGSGGLERLGATLLAAGERPAAPIVLAGSNLYVGTYASPAQVVKLTADLGSSALPVRVDGITLETGENQLWRTAFSHQQYLYFSTYTNPGRIVRCVDPAL